MFRNSTKLIFGLALLTSAACGGGHPVQIGVYTPYPRDEVFTNIRNKVVELGYTVQRADTTNYEILASRELDPPVTGADREEMAITIVPDVTGVPKLTITTARVMRATADRPAKRVAAGSKTTRDANTVLQMYMQVKPPTVHQQ
jgi:hypothetical protein